jgi:hypothetical protein
MRSNILDGQEVPHDLERLYDRSTGELAIRDLHVPLVGGDLDTPQPVRLTPNIWAFRCLFRCFAGVLADIKLPKGAFFSGSSVFAAATMPCDLATPAVIHTLTMKGKQHEQVRQVAKMAISRWLGNRIAVATKILHFVGGADLAEIQDLRKSVAASMPKRKGYETTQDDVLYWDWNGFGTFARSDIDIFLAADSLNKADAIAKELYNTVLRMEDGDICTLRTPNTITFARGYPERHCQCVLYIMPRIHHHLLFADFDCTASALVDGVPFTSRRSKVALSTKLNFCPTSMLAIRRDTPKRLASYIKRGIVPYFSEDPRAGDVTTLMERVREEVNFRGKKYLDLTVVAGEWKEDELAFDLERAVSYLISSNTSYNTWNVPRMVYLAAQGIGCFFNKLAENAAQQDEEGQLVTAVVGSSQGIPSCAFKLQKSRRETWVSYGMVPDSDAMPHSEANRA